ncbi:MAG TPA: hypothetical protein VN201_05780 [Roseateles sp.]|nr:hypothetical protein [Roseateles sp.]
MSQCDAFGLLAREAAQAAAQVIRVVNGWQAHFAAAGVTDRDIESLAERIDADELRSQRGNFDPSTYEAATVKVKRARPFFRPGPR